MPLLKSVDPGGEIYLSFAKKKLNDMHAQMAGSGVRSLHRTVLVTDGSQIFLDSLLLSHGIYSDRIRITTSGGFVVFGHRYSPDRSKPPLIHLVSRKAKLTKRFTVDSGFAWTDNVDNWHAATSSDGKKNIIWTRDGSANATYVLGAFDGKGGGITTQVFATTTGTGFSPRTVSNGAATKVLLLHPGILSGAAQDVWVFGIDGSISTTSILPAGETARQLASSDRSDAATVTAISATLEAYLMVLAIGGTWSKMSLFSGTVTTNEPLNVVAQASGDGALIYSAVLVGTGVASTSFRIYLGGLKVYDNAEAFDPAHLVPTESQWPTIIVNKTGSAAAVSRVTDTSGTPSGSEVVVVKDGAATQLIGYLGAAHYPKYFATGVSDAGTKVSVLRQNSAIDMDALFFTLVDGAWTMSTTPAGFVVPLDSDPRSAALMTQGIDLALFTETFHVFNGTGDEDVTAINSVLDLVEGGVTYDSEFAVVPIPQQI